MDQRMKDMAKKGAGGDEDAALMLILDSPEGHFKGGEPKDYAKKVADDGEYKEDGMTDEAELAKVAAIEEVLVEEGVGEDAGRIAQAVCDAIKSGRIPMSHMGKGDDAY
jgi:hypothetical protein